MTTNWLGEETGVDPGNTGDLSSFLGHSGSPTGGVEESFWLKGHLVIIITCSLKYRTLMLFSTLIRLLFTLNYFLFWNE